MGVMMSKPEVSKTGKAENKGKFEVASLNMQGWIRYMNDVSFYSLNFDGNGKSIFGILGGFGDHVMAQFVSNYFVEELLKNKFYQEGKYKQALEQNFLRMDELAQEKQVEQEYTQNGTNATIMLIVNDTIYCAHCGHSRAAILKDTNCIPLSFEHWPNNPSEKTRIEEAGGFIEHERVNGNLSISRSIGYLCEKRNASNPENKNPKQFIITAFPDVTEVPLTQDISLIVLGSDGIFEEKSTEQILDYFHNKEGDLTELSTSLFDSLLAEDCNQKSGCHNMSMIVIRVDHNKN